MDAFKPLSLPEESPPLHAIECQRCELAKQRQRVIWGEGNPNAPIFILKVFVQDLKLVSDKMMSLH